MNELPRTTSRIAAFRAIVLIVSATLLAWLLLQAVHEFGHVLGAWLTGGTVQRVVLHPLNISRTDVGPNPRPLIVVWAGPIFGVLAPLAIWCVAAVLKSPLAWLARFFAGCCLIGKRTLFGRRFIRGDRRCGRHHPPWQPHLDAVAVRSGNDACRLVVVEWSGANVWPGTASGRSRSTTSLRLSRRIRRDVWNLVRVLSMKLKRIPEDFQVDEQIALEATGGPIALYRLTKQSLGTREAIDAVARRWNLPLRAMAFAGLKDRHA